MTGVSRLLILWVVTTITDALHVDLNEFAVLIQEKQVSNRELQEERKLRFMFHTIFS
jgi:hypothetical protein